jgi:hypothetical protein
MVTAVLVLLMWTTPITRTDGTALEAHEIEYYEVQRNRELYTTTTENHAEAAHPGLYRVMCCDVHSRCSVWSNELRVKRRKK